MVERFVDTSFNVRNTFGVDMPWKNWWPELGRSYLLRMTPQFFIDWTAVENFCSFIGLKSCPTFKNMEDTTRETLGVTINFEKTGIRWSRIEVNQFLIPKAASLMIAHELVHALQHEQNRWDRAVNHINPGNLGQEGYWNHPLEREAREYEEYGLHTMLVKEL